MADLIRYDLLTQQALRGVVRKVLTDAANKGLPGDHHFFIEFDTAAPGVRMSDRLRVQHPQKMTVILQHQFWDLAVTEQGFEVGLSFGGVGEKLAIPYDAITGFFDPSVKFGLQFEEFVEGQGFGEDRPAPANAQGKTQEKAQKAQEKKPDGAADKPAPKKRFPASVPAVAASDAPDDGPEPDKPKSGGGEVVRLDRFRKK